MSDFAAVAVLGAVAGVVAALAIAASFVLGPRRPTPVKSSPYESGMTALGPAQRQLPVGFYLIATLFILFDIEIIFLVPWAVQFRALTREFGWFVLAEMAVFLGILALGFVHVWRRGALDWDI
jgi:NADH-quinone oxidoreductase subunit A